MQAGKNTKRAYVKPRLRVIELAAEEVLAVGCKIAGNPNTAVGGLPSCGIPTCNQDGS